MNVGKVGNPIGTSPELVAEDRDGNSRAGSFCLSRPRTRHVRGREGDVRHLCSQATQAHSGSSPDIQQPPKTSFPALMSRSSFAVKIGSPYPIVATRALPQFGHFGGFDFICLP